MERVSSPLFVGRRDERDTLGGALARVRDGEGSVVLVGGEAGMGKSRLIGEFARVARGDGATVLSGECLPLAEGELPYAPIVAALRVLARERGTDGLEALAGPTREELALLLPELGSHATAEQAPSEGSQARLFEQLLAVLLAAAQVSPLVLVIEDLHWSDRSTRDFLVFLVRAARRERVMLVVTYRSDDLQRRHPARPFLHELERSGQAIRLQLAPFSRSELHEQVAAITGSPPEPAFVDRLEERAEGNPFFTEELLVSADEPGAGLPESLREALLMRLEGRSSPVEAVLRIVAVAGREVDHALLGALADLPAPELMVALREAVESHLLVHGPDSPGYSFRHALLREAVYADLLPGEREALHLAFARVLEERPELAGSKATATAELAYHWHAGREPSQALIASVLAAIEAEEVHAFGEALLHFERALDIWDSLGEPPDGLPLDRIDVMRRAAEAANLTGSMERAIELTRETLGRLDSQDAVRTALVHERLGRYLWTVGRSDAALPEYRRAVEIMPASPPSRERAHVLAAEAQVLALCNRNQESALRCQEALSIAHEVGADGVEANVLNTLCVNFSSNGETAKAAMAAERGRTIAQRLGLVEEIGRSYVNGSDALDQAGLLQESIALAGEGIEACRKLGAREISDFLRAELVGRLLRTGCWEEAGVLLEALDERDLVGVSAGTTYGHLGLLQAQRGEFDAASRSLARAAEQVARAGGSMWVGPLGEARATNELWAGHPQAAAQVVEECLTGMVDGEWVFFTAKLYELGARAHAENSLLESGDEEACQRESKRAAALLERLDGLIAQMPGSPPPRALASRVACVAECSRLGGGHDPGAWATAERHWQACGDSYEVAYARWRQAEALLGAQGERAAAHVLIDQAHTTARDLHARPLLEQIEALARRARLDLRDGPSGASKPDDALSRFELTPRELEVLALLGDGMTNREIAAELYISNKTASVHVSRILSKLSVPNRSAAAAAAQRLGVRSTGEPTGG